MTWTAQRQTAFGHSHRATSTLVNNSKKVTFVLRAKRKKDSQTMIGQTDILNRKKGYGQEYMTLHYMVDKRKWTFKLTDRQTHI